MMGNATRAEAIEMGNRRELFIDDWMIAELSGTAARRLHEPVPREIALRTDAPWEGCRGGYITVIDDGDILRMYYKANHSWNTRSEAGSFEEHATTLRIAYAESRDGVEWTKPNLGLYEICGSVRNNIVWDGIGSDRTGVHGFSPFRDTRPGVSPDERYKAFGTKIGDAAEEGIYRFKSADAIHWRLFSGPPAITEGKFDSQNLAFWDTARGEYRAYLRGFHPAEPGPYRADDKKMGVRDIRTCASTDFEHWSKPEPIRLRGAPEEAFYTNQIAPYYRAPHILLGFPARYVERPWSETIEALPDLEDRRERSGVSPRFGTVTTDTVLIASRDGVDFVQWPEVFLRPGPFGGGGWGYGDAFVANGLFETESPVPGAPKELSLLAIQGYWRGDDTVFRRYSLRIDGFASIHADMYGGEAITHPVSFDGDDLFLNYSTSAAGRILLEIQEPDGTPIDGFSADECHEITGDELERRVTWQNGVSPGRLRQRPVRLRVVMHDADLYSLRFGG